MARIFTVGTLVTRVRILGDYLEAPGTDYAESYMTDEVVIEALSVANADTSEVYAESDQDFNTVRSTLTLSSASLYDLPDDFFTLRAVEVEASDSVTGYYPLQRANADDNYYGPYGGTASPQTYRLFGDQIELLPTSSGVGSVRLSYVPAAPILSSSLQTIDGVNGYEQLVVLRAIRYLRYRDGQSTADWDLQIREAEERMRKSCRRRDRAAPRRMRDPRTIYRRDRW